jgi:F420-dependent oxidoreductase-like protein
MDLRIFTEPQQGADYDQLLAVASVAEECGFDAFFRSDHYLTMGGTGRPGPTDAWITLAGLARDTSRIRLGTLVTSATFRHPGPLAVSVAEVDRMSGGRVELGLGAGWYDDEHRAFGIPFPPTGERFDRLEEQLEVITGLWSTPEGQPYTHEGVHYPVSHPAVLTNPQQSPLPIIVGGGGPKRTPRLAARFAAEFNLPFSPPDFFTAQRERVIDACEALGRDRGTMTFSAALVLACGEDEAAFERRAAAIGRQPDELRTNGACGTVADVVETLQRWGGLGAERVYLQVLDLGDLDHLRLVAAEVMPRVG